jgi:phage terminase large subunit-like protein
LFIVTTTAAEHNDGLAFEQYQHARKVFEGHVVDPDLYPFIIEADPDKADTPEEQIRCNPLVAEGFIPIENLQAENQQAKVSDDALALFKRKTLNMWVGSSFAYLSGKCWLEQTEAVDDTHLVGLPCVAAFDLSKTRDFTALVLVFYEPLEEQGYRYFVKPYFWLPSEGIEERQEQDGQPYTLWVEQGHLELSEGPTIDYHLVLDKLKALSAIFTIKEVAYDPAFAEYLVQDITSAGFTSSPYPNKFLQMTAPLQTLQALVLNKHVIHGNHPVMNWQVPQLEVKTNEGGGLMPSRKNRKAKIDGVVALLMGLGTVMRHQVAAPKMQSSLTWFLDNA